LLGDGWDRHCRRRGRRAAAAAGQEYAAEQQTAETPNDHELPPRLSFWPAVDLVFVTTVRFCHDRYKPSQVRRLFGAMMPDPAATRSGHRGQHSGFLAYGDVG
jgi:hypothetical protein